MKQVVAAWSLGIVLLAAIAACAANLPTASDLASYESKQDVCIVEADAKASADTCRAAVKSAFCVKWPASCPSGLPKDGGE